MPAPPTRRQQSRPASASGGFRLSGALSAKNGKLLAITGLKRASDADFSPKPVVSRGSKPVLWKIYWNSSSGGGGNRTLPRPKEPAALANILEVSIVDYLLERVEGTLGPEVAQGLSAGTPMSIHRLPLLRDEFERDELDRVAASHRPEFLRPTVTRSARSSERTLAHAMPSRVLRPRRRRSSFR
jgi:hypothetical protein